MTVANDDGFTLVELLVSMMLLSIISVGLYQVMFSSVRGSDDTQEIAQISQEARLGFNRMIRDTREAARIVTATSTSYRIWTDFNANNVVDANDYEYVQYSVAGGEIQLTPLSAPAQNLAPRPQFSGNEAVLAGEQAETLIAGVGAVNGQDIFTYSSNFLQFDTSPANGETTAAEIEAAVGDGTAGLTGTELEYVSDVNYAFTVSVDERTTEFFGQASIRSRRFSDL